MSSKKPKVDPASPFAKLQALKDQMDADAKAAAKAASERAAARGRGDAAVGSGHGPSKGQSPARGREREAPYVPLSPPRSPSPGARARAREEADDAIAFHRLVSGVTPLDDGSRRIRLTQQQHAPEPAMARDTHRRQEVQALIDAEAGEVHEHLRTLLDGGPRFEVSDDGKKVEGRRIDLPPDVVRKLRRGLFPIDARLDMHGMRASEAAVKLEAFLRDQRVRGERCVLVVHGKGEHSPTGVGVLRGEIAAWLSQGRASEQVAAFSTAMGGDGGEGAVYVLLRR